MKTLKIKIKKDYIKTNSGDIISGYSSIDEALQKIRIENKHYKKIKVSY